MSTYRPPPKPRKTLDLSGTAQALEVKLSHEGALAVAYARRYLKNPGQGVDVLASGVVRRSLVLYVEHLSALVTAEQQRAEYRAAKQCCSARAVDDEERLQADERLRSYGEGLPLPPFPEVLHGAAAVAQAAAMHARINAQVDGHMDALWASKQGRLILGRDAAKKRKAAEAATALMTTTTTETTT